jgi:transcriptional regulator with XRE-family HTH domain
MDYNELTSDEALLEELGRRLARQRVAMELTQADLAEQAGISKRTVERVEAGESAQTATLVSILRILDLLDGLYSLLPAAGPRPMDLLKLKGKERRRASKKRKDQPKESWSWDDGA